MTHASQQLCSRGLRQRSFRKLAWQPQPITKENDATNLRQQAAVHNGEGVITRRLFFRHKSQLPIRFDMWELPPGASEGDHTHAGDDPLEEM